VAGRRSDPAVRNPLSVEPGVGGLEGGLEGWLEVSGLDG